MSILIFFIILLVLVLFHEFGHFSTAKSFKIRVDEFGFGFPPRLFGIKKGETEYTFNLLPIGGFVKIFGENPDEENINGIDKDRSFANKPKWQQAIVLFAGVFANFLLAWFLFSFGFMSGLPTSVGSEMKGQKLSDINLVIVSVLQNSPASEAGLKTGDKILSVDSGTGGSVLKGEKLNPESLKVFISSNANKKISVVYKRGDISGNTQVIPKILESNTPMIGISMDMIGVSKLGFLNAFYEGMKLNLNVTKDTVLGLYRLVKDAVVGNGSLDSVTGPVGLVKIAGDAYQFGFAYIAYFAGLISINLAIVNLLPFPALDGGRLFFLLIEKIKGSRLSPKFSNMANMIGFGILIILMLFVTYHDIVKLF